MVGPGFIGFQGFLTEAGVKLEFIFYWRISQIFFVGFGVFIIIVINYLKGGFYRLEKAVSYYELLWTIMPTFILFIIAVPRIGLLYFHEQEAETVLTIKCEGHQWYWRYEYGNFEGVEFDRFMLPTEELEEGINRYLEVDNRVVLPVNRGIRFLVRRRDVIHRWALPVISLKIDATPGRLNSINRYFEQTGVFFGQCRELCGANHPFMPICVEITLPSFLKEWLIKF